MVYFIGVGLMADESSRIELILENSFDTCVLPQETVCDLGFVVAKPFSEYLLLIISLGFYPLLIEYPAPSARLLRPRGLRVGYARLLRQGPY